MGLIIGGSSFFFVCFVLMDVCVVCINLFCVEKESFVWECWCMWLLLLTSVGMLVCVDVLCVQT